MAVNSIFSVLVVEDNPVLASTLRCVFVGLGWNVDFAASGKLALRLGQQHTYDVVLMDHHLPDMDGAEVCRLLKFNTTSQSVVFLIRCDELVDAIGHIGADAVFTTKTDCKEIVNQCRAVASQRFLSLSA
ncbi:response regulator transcription factor [Alteromonas aestuariivivens]|nr:response regulator [Alteromonas aestuariivivens]